jgi:DNA-binding NtrC family response regulator
MNRYGDIMTMIRILVVHAHEALANALSLALQLEGFEVMIAASTGSGLTLLWQNQPNIVLVSAPIAMMEDCAFLKACFRLLLQQVTVVVMNAPKAVKPTLKVLGVAGFLDIPFSLSDIKDCLNMAMSSGQS